jgi:stress-induced morphogen
MASTRNGLHDPQVAQIVRTFQAAGFRKVDAYRYNSASIRLRVISKKFQGLESWQRYDIVNKIIATLPEDIQRDMMFSVLVTPAEVADSTKNAEFEHPSPPLDLDFAGPG